MEDLLDTACVLEVLGTVTYSQSLSVTDDLIRYPYPVGNNDFESIMSKPDTWLLDHQASIFSQAGEDGVVGKILETLPSKNMWCVEFGAFDGEHLSNTRHLIDSQGYSAVLIEASASRYQVLKKKFSDNTKVVTFNRFVGFRDDDNLDTILGKTEVPDDFDFLSIDIDGNDYHVWKAFRRYTPKIVCIEFNQTIPNEVTFVQPADPKISQGSSLSALVELGKEKGYELVSVVGVNAVFVLKKYFSLFEIENNGPEVLRTDQSGITYLFVGYDGTIFLRGQSSVFWHHGLPISESKVQQLPRFLRKFPGNYSQVELIVFGMFLLISHPKILVSAIRRRFFRRILKKT
jgi:hypothetical protein